MVLITLTAGIVLGLNLRQRPCQRLSSFLGSRVSVGTADPVREVADPVYDVGWPVTCFETTPGFSHFADDLRFRYELERLRADFSKPFTPLGEEEETDGPVHPSPAPTAQKPDLFANTVFDLPGSGSGNVSGFSSSVPAPTFWQKTVWWFHALTPLGTNVLTGLGLMLLVAIINEFRVRRAMPELRAPQPSVAP